MDVSKVALSRAFHGLEIELHRHAGARVVRVVHPEPQQIDEHRHDWAYIGIHMMGRYREICEAGEAVMDGPCAVLHPAGRPHADSIDDTGLETLTIEFDIAWLRRHGFCRPLDRSRIWQGGAAGLAARELARTIARPDASEAVLGQATSRFLHVALHADAAPAPPWLETAAAALNAARPPSTAVLADRLGLHPAWLSRAYRQATGEGLHETLRRRRVEQACGLLRRTGAPLADIAHAAGFCDQSHMNRSFRAVIGRTPLQARGERFVEQGFAGTRRQ